MKELLKKIFNYKTTVIVILLMFVAKFLGFIKNIFLAKYYGTSVISDAYQMAISISMIIVGMVLYSYQAFTKGYYMSEKYKRENEYTSTFLNFILVILVVIFAIMIVFEKNIIKIFAPGFNSEQITYTINFLIPITIGTIFLVVANILSEYLRCKNSYVISQVAYLTVNIIEIITILIAFYIDCNWLSYGYLLANFIYLVILVFLCIKKNLKYQLVLKKEEIRIFSKILIPIFFSSVITDINSMIDKIFASNSGTGIVSTLSYATNIKTVTLIIAAGFLTVLFPKISKKIVERDFINFKKIIKKSLLIILIIYIPITIFFITFSVNIVKIVYYRGAFDLDSLNKTSICLQMYVIGVTGISIRDLYIKALYCLEKGRFVIGISIISVAINTLLNIMLFRRLGYVGLPLATSLSVWIVILILIYYYKKNIKELINLRDNS